VDRLSRSFEGLGGVLGLSPDAFVRTTSAAHKESVRELWRRLDANGALYVAAYEGWCA